MSPDPFLLDPLRVRALFRRHRGQSDFVAREASTRMGERLEYIKVDPTLVLDAGSGAGHDLSPLKRRFPEATFIALDTNECALRLCPGLRNSRPGPLWRLFPHHASVWGLSADFAAMPLRSNMLDVIWSNLALHWHSQPKQTLEEWRRCLKAGGLLMFSAFGPDTLKEIRTAFAAVDDYPHTHAFTDMHDYGDMLVEAGFVTPVMDMEMLTLTYSKSEDLIGEVRRLGGNALLDRRRGLLSRAQADRLLQGLDATRGADGRYRLSFEILFGHAWAGIPRNVKDGRAIIHFERGTDVALGDGMQLE